MMSNNSDNRFIVVMTLVDVQIYHILVNVQKNHTDNVTKWNFSYSMCYKCQGLNAAFVVILQPNILLLHS